MVAFELKPSLELASCCKVEVVNGAAGLRVPGVFAMSETVNFAPWRLSRKARASSSVSNFWLSSALNSCPSTKNSATTLNCDVPSNFMISCSRSTSKRTAGLWTRPADLPPGTFCHTTGLNSNPTSRSSTCLACCACTRFISTVRGCLMAFVMASLVIS